jgi:hypothetical protein
MATTRSVLAVLAVSAISACGDLDEYEIGRWQQPLTAYCSVNVVGKGTKKMEGDYLAHVVACENGAADMEALKAQAVAARTYAYYKIKSAGQVKDGQSDQVYSCGKSPSAKHYQAVKETSGQVLRYKGTVICSFYVAGAKPSTSSCVAKSSDPDPTYTEKYVTYNQGKTGNNIKQSSLGWVSSSNVFNRGCMSQNGSHCLSLGKKSYKQILKFYYGADIELVTATGSCVTPPEPEYPVLTIKTTVKTIPGQERDLCKSDGSEGIFDWWAGDQTEVHVDVKNKGTAVAKEVNVKLWAEEPYLSVTRWTIYSDNKGDGFSVNDTDGMQTIEHDSPGKSFKLWLGSISPGETKRIELAVRAEELSIGLVDHPDVRAWVAKIEGYYAKGGFWDQPTKNTGSYQTQNDGDLRAYVQTDVLDEEICDELDNDCDGEVDEGCQGEPRPIEGGEATPGFVAVDDDHVMEGSGCAVSSAGSSTALPIGLVLVLLLLGWNRRRDRARRRGAVLVCLVSLFLLGLVDLDGAHAGPLGAEQLATACTGAQTPTLDRPCLVRRGHGKLRTPAWTHRGLWQDAPTNKMLGLSTGERAGAPVYDPESRAWFASANGCLVRIEPDGRLPVVLNGVQGIDVDIRARRGIAVSREPDHRIVLHSWRGGSKKELLLSGSRFFNPRFSPDGRQILVAESRAAGGHFWVVTPGGRAKDMGQGYDAVWHPSGRWVVFSRISHDGHRVTSADLWAMDASTRTMMILAKTTGISEVEPVFSPDGRWIAFKDAASGDLYVARLPVELLPGGDR